MIMNFLSKKSLFLMVLGMTFLFSGLAFAADQLTIGQKAALEMEKAGIEGVSLKTPIGSVNLTPKAAGKILDEMDKLKESVASGEAKKKFLSVLQDVLIGAPGSAQERRSMLLKRAATHRHIKTVKLALESSTPGGADHRMFTAQLKTCRKNAFDIDQWLAGKPIPVKTPSKPITPKDVANGFKGVRRVTALN